MTGPHIPSGKEPDDGPLIDAGPSEIEIERRQAGVEEGEGKDEDPGAPVLPETPLPPD
ncbi:hypothetical protein [Tsuneonella sp. SYSU-LHT278]|uniref:hypothetical protein n=1 Tax=Tsuneonella sediminis TaxID=3416089 RepID=UPI003F7AB44E